jgi:hypothetical protein
MRALLLLISNMKKGLLLFLWVVSFSTAYSNTDKQLWFGFVHQARLTKHWGYWIDIHHRTKNDFLKNLHVELFRAGGTYFINDQWRISLGYAFISQFPSLTNQSFVRLEHRPWQQVFHAVTIKQFRITQYLRNEQRLLQKTSGEKIVDGYVFRDRLRYSIMLHFLFNKSKSFKQNSIGAVVVNEVFVNAYSSDKVSIYDQNRAFGGLFYNLTDALQLHAGYMNVFSKTPKGNEVIHAVRLFAFYTVDLRKKK